MTKGDDVMSLTHTAGTATHLFASALWLRLSKRYAEEYDADFGEQLATAVSNDLLSRSPGEDNGRTFQAAHRPLVQEKVREIKEHPDLCHLLSQAVRTQALLHGVSIRVSGPTELLEAFDKCLKPILKLQKYGLYDDVEMATGFFALRRQMKAFIRDTTAFHAQVESETDPVSGSRSGAGAKPSRPTAGRAGSRMGPRCPAGSTRVKNAS
jgi:hypothetical protein